MKWMCASMPPAVTILPSPAMISVPYDDADAGLDIGIARLADGGDAPLLEGDVGLVDAGPVDDDRVGDDRVGGPCGIGDLALAHAVADYLASTEFHLLAQDRAIALDLDDEVGVGEAHPVARRGSEHIGIGSPGDAVGHQVISPRHGEGDHAKHGGGGLR
jgi:hypothetical protein